MLEIPTFVLNFLPKPLFIISATYSIIYVFGSDFNIFSEILLRLFQYLLLVGLFYLVTEQLKKHKFGRNQN